MAGGKLLNARRETRDARRETRDAERETHDAQRRAQCSERRTTDDRRRTLSAKRRWPMRQERKHRAGDAMTLRVPNEANRRKARLPQSACAARTRVRRFATR
ncbi:hypothetical protein GA845_27375 [Burkholderia pseudomallei]|nr:hypothetical protein [Burkholderia pseudomallei]